MNRSSDSRATISGAIKTIREIQPLARELAKNLSEIDLFSLLLLRRKGAFEQDTLNEFEALCEGKGSKLQTFLVQLGNAAESALDELVSQSARREVNVYGSAKDNLAGFCGQLFGEYRPDDVKSTQGGDFRTFVAHVWELTFGEEEDLESAVKREVKFRKRQKDSKPAFKKPGK